MRLCFLGHQCFSLQGSQTHILIDPLLLDSFGHSEKISFKIFAPRKIDISRMPPVNAVLLSHEHPDHFHIPSLSHLKPGTPCYIGPMMPECVSRALRRLALNVHTVRLREPIQIGEFRVLFFPADARTIFWEQRVTQIHIESNAMKKSIFLGVDAIIGSAYKSAVEKGSIQMPYVIVCANNSQVAPPGIPEVHTNMLPISQNSEPKDGLRILYGILVQYLQLLPSCEHVVICGNGFVSSRQPYGPFMFSDNGELAKIANLLQFGSAVHGPLPGWMLDISKEKATVGRVKWIKLRKGISSALRTRHNRYLSKPKRLKFEPTYQVNPSRRQVVKHISFVEKQLPALAREFLLSNIGALANATHEYLCGPLGGKRFLLRLHTGVRNNVLQYALDFTRAKFVKDHTREEDIVRKFPFGLELFITDLAALLSGNLIVWDLSSTSIRSWYMGNKYLSPVAFLYTVLGEQVRPDLAWLVYKRVLTKLGR